MVCVAESDEAHVLDFARLNYTGSLQIRGSDIDVKLVIQNKVYSDVNSLNTATNSKLTRLIQILWLTANRIRLIRANSFAGLIQLKNLDLQQNSIGEVEANAFAGLLNLNLMLYLYSNEIRLLRNGTFASLEILEYLYLNENRIECIETDSFLPLKKLKMLSLEANSMRLITVETFNSLAK